MSLNGLHCADVHTTTRSLYLSFYLSDTWGVRNPVKILGIGFLKTEPNRPRNSKNENSAVRFSKTDFGGLGTVFQVVSFTIHLVA